MKHMIMKIEGEKKTIIATFNKESTAKKVFAVLNVRKHKQPIFLYLDKHHEKNASTII
jgi:hypothetical protein